MGFCGRELFLHLRYEELFRRYCKPICGLRFRWDYICLHLLLHVIVYFYFVLDKETVAQLSRLVWTSVVDGISGQWELSTCCTHTYLHCLLDSVLRYVR